MSFHLFHVDKTAPQQTYAMGSRIDVNKSNMPILEGMALSLLTLQPKSMREPHWHPNANELGYCISGKALMTIFSPGAAHNTLIIEPGTLSFVPMGSLHHVENIGTEPLKMALCFDNNNPEDLNLSSAIGSMPSQALANTFQLEKDFFEQIHASIKPVFITGKKKHPALLDAWRTNTYKMDIDATEPQIRNRGGWVKMSKVSMMSSLRGLALYSLQLNPKGTREPHWHPNAHELNYLISGAVRITILSPGGKLDSFEMSAGDMSFLPRGYLHDIETIGDDPARLAVFFNHNDPSDMGISGCLGAYPNELLAELFKVPSSYFNDMPKYQSDLLIVGGG